MIHNFSGLFPSAFGGVPQPYSGPYAVWEMREVICFWLAIFSWSLFLSASILETRELI
jgi:hypothetical protein